jgi:pimeloyl-ACP methyl ester carboxylesterase
VGTGEPPLVLLPGGLTGWQSWLPLVPALATKRRVVRVQLIANAEGMAGRIGDPTYDVAVERESLSLTLDSLGVEDMHLVGWSNGGRMALDFALAYPTRIRTLTAIEPAAWWLVSDVDESARDFGEFIAGCAGRNCSGDDVRDFLIGAGVGAPDTDFEALPQWDFWLSCRQVLSWYNEKVVRSAVAGIDGFERLDIPTLLVRGRSTAPWLSEVVDVLERGLPDASVVELDGGHASILESRAREPRRGRPGSTHIAFAQQTRTCPQLLAARYDARSRRSNKTAPTAANATAATVTPAKESGSMPLSIALP